MAKAEILSGVCGFKTTVQVESQGTINVESDCPNIKKMAAELPEVDAMQELFKKGESKIIALGQKLPHVTCPVPVGILKALEVSAGMALPKDVSISIEK